MGVVPGQGTKIPHAEQPKTQNTKQRQHFKQIKTLQMSHMKKKKVGWAGSERQGGQAEGKCRQFARLLTLCLAMNAGSWNVHILSGVHYIYLCLCVTYILFSNLGGRGKSVDTPTQENVTHPPACSLLF